MWHPTTEKPEIGKRIVAIFSDGDGATMFLVHDHGLMDESGEDIGIETLGKDFSHWSYLPDGFRLCAEDAPGDLYPT